MATHMGLKALVAVLVIAFAGAPQQAVREALDLLRQAIEKLQPLVVDQPQVGIIDVPVGADLQAAISSAPDGATLRLAAGTWTGNFVASKRLIVTGAAVIGNGRVTPSDLSAMPRLVGVSNGAAMSVTASNVTFNGIAFIGNPNGSTSDIVNCGWGDARQSREDQIPRNVSFDQVLVLGDVNNGAKRGIAAQCGGQVTRSHVGSIFNASADSTGIGTWNSNQPFTIDDTHVEAGSYPILLGGADGIVPDVLPTDWLVKNSYLGRPADWKNKSRRVKNLFEVKAGRRVTLRSSILENNWNEAQPGWSIVITPAGDGVGTARASITVEDVVIEDNIVRNVQAGLNVLGTSNQEGVLGRTTRLTIRRNAFFIDRTFNGSPYGQGWFMQCSDGLRNEGMRDVSIQQNTIVMNGNQIVTCGGAPVPGFSMTGNLVQTPGLYGFFLEIDGANRAYGQRWQEFFLGGVIGGNGFIGAPSLMRTYVTGNAYFTTTEAAGLIDGAGYASGALAAYGRPRN